MKVLTAAQMQAVDRRTIDEIGIPGVVLMENAGRGVFEAIVECYASACRCGVLVVAGKGNNGGDGYVIARLLLDHGWQVETMVLATDRSEIRGDAAINLQALEHCGGRVRFAANRERFEAALQESSGFGLLVDAIFGTGLTKPVTGFYAEVIDWLNERPEPVVSVDIPSGIDASSGRILGNCVSAETTVTFAFPKVGQVSYPGAGHVGELVLTEIGIPSIVAEATEAEHVLVDGDTARRLVPVRPVDGHKGTFGHLVVVAGSVGKSGAAGMSAEAGLRGGAGLVTLACPRTVQPVVAAQLSEVMTVPLPDADGEVSSEALGPALALLEQKQALAIGPGLGLGDQVRSFIRCLLTETSQPAVIDADGLTALGQDDEVLQARRGRETVLTPHPGEMARLTGLSVAEIQADRVTVARDYAVRKGVVLVLKGARTVTATPEGMVYINRSGHAGQASGGMGDILTGLIGSLLVQGLPAATAAALAVFLHGHAADRLIEDFGDCGLLATDLLRELPVARRSLSEEVHYDDRA